MLTKSSGYVILYSVWVIIQLETGGFYLAYKTKQGSDILDYMISTAGKHVNINDISEHFRKCGKSVGTATIYRHLDKLVRDGVVAKYVTDNTGSACYEYLDVGSCRKADCYHFKCVGCGKLIHLECHEVNNFMTHLEQSHGFKIDPVRTVFYGSCADCAEADGDTEQKEGN
ncbi:MAG: transcriptional repressor [Ruminococcus sp.]|nr:transcriptional repressor [Ruminococcus sp.]